MSNLQPFAMPEADVTSSLSVTTTTASLGFEEVAQGNQAMFVNITSQGCYIAVGGDAVEATATCMYLTGNTMRVFSIDPNATHFAAKTPTGTTTLIAVRGNGF